MKKVNALRYKVLCGALLLAACGGELRAQNTNQLTTAWVDGIWTDHLLWRADLLYTNRSAHAEAFCRDVQQLDPGNLRSLELLARTYALKGEAALLAAVAGLAGELYPLDAQWKDAKAQADVRIYAQPRAPTDEDLLSRTNQFVILFAEAVQAREKDRNLLVSELALRRLLLDYPLNLNLLEELSLTYRLAREWPLCAAINRLGYEAYPENRAFLFNYVEATRLMGRPDLGWSRMKTVLDTGDADPDLLALAATTGSAAGTLDAALDRIDQATRDDVTGDTLIALSRTLIGRQQLDAARALAERAHRRMPARIEPVYDLAVISSLTGDADAAIAWLKRLRDRVPEARFSEMITAGPFPTNALSFLDAEAPDAP
jgi:hypothetical protein